jgi:DNA-binding transcriptional LysR family regulator
MQIESLEVFCDVARHRSFSQAAQARGVTQSAASQVVSQLEKDLGVQLIDRSTRPLRLTPLGQKYYEGCAVLLEQYLELKASIRTAHAQLAGTVRVAAIYSVGLSDMGQLVQRFNVELPDVRVHLEFLHPDKVYEHVLTGTADIGLVSFPRKHPKLACQRWREEPMVLACTPIHPLARYPGVAVRQLTGERYIHFDRDLHIRREIDRFLRDHGVTIEVVHEFDNIENIKKAVELGAGIALLPEPTLRREVEAQTLVARPLRDGRLVRPLGIIHRRHHKLSSTAHRLVELLREAGGLDDDDHDSNGAPFASAGQSPRGRPRATRTPQRTGSP